MNVITIEMVTETRKREEIIRTFRQFIEPTEAQPGCTVCRLLEDLKGEKSLVYMEAWISESDLLRRICSAQFKKILAVMELSSAPPEFRIHTVSETRGLEAIRMLRKTQPTPGGSPQDAFRRLIANQE